MKTNKGFTLIELLVVVSIIALLVAILMPALNRARNQASAAVCVGNQRSLLTAWIMYADENDGLLVGGNTGQHWYWCPSFGFPWDWVQCPEDPSYTMEGELDGIRRGALYPYVDTVEVYHCPGDQRAAKLDQGYRSYSICWAMNALMPGQVTRMTQIRTPADKLVFVEEKDEQLTSEGTTRPFNLAGWACWEAGVNWFDPLAVWHNGGSTLGYADGHAEIHKWSDERTIQFFETSSSEYVASPDNEDLVFLQMRLAKAP